MTNRLTHQAIAFSLAALMTVGVLASLSGLANSDYRAAQAELAQAPATSQPAA